MIEVSIKVSNMEFSVDLDFGRGGIYGFDRDAGDEGVSDDDGGVELRLEVNLILKNKAVSVKVSKMNFVLNLMAV